jgi:CopG family nickel-responsive transcriptional regulator
MKDDLVRFGVAMDGGLLAEADALVKARGGTRSELLRDLVRAEVQRCKRTRHVPAVATLTLVYDHHVRDLTERLTDMQHELGDSVRSTLHVHLDHDRCLEVIVIRGWADDIRREADRLLAARGVLHGGLEIYATEAPKQAHAHDRRARAHDHVAHEPHAHGRGAHSADDGGHTRADGHARRSRRAAASRAS